MGIGLRRQKFGDLIFSDGTWQFICSEEVADFVFTQLTQIGKVKVSLEKFRFLSLKYRSRMSK